MSVENHRFRKNNSCHLIKNFFEIDNCSEALLHHVVLNDQNLNSRRLDRFFSTHKLVSLLYLYLQSLPKSIPEEAASSIGSGSPAPINGSVAALYDVYMSE